MTSAISRFGAVRYLSERIWLLILLSRPACAAVTATDLFWNFECGSLGSAAAVQSNELNLTLRLDDPYGDLYGWYNFKIQQNAAGQVVTFHILNPDNWMNANHRPVYSQDGGQSWARINDTWMANGDFHFRQQFSADSVWIALVFPYGYSRLMGELAILGDSPYCNYAYVGLSVHQREIPLVTITDPTVSESAKRTAWLMSRQHPMETATSFILESLMEFLLDPTQPAADRLRRTTIYKIFPMVNVDGVVEGLSRHNVNGFNLNRCWAYDSLYAGEQSEVNACHLALDNWVYSGHELDLFNDFHCAPDLYDFGYKLSATYSYPTYNQDLTSFSQHLDYWDPYQDWTLWRDMESSYGTGLVTMALYNQHGLVASSSENSWSRRGNGEYLTLASLAGEGLFWALAVDDYLHQVRLTDSTGAIAEVFQPQDRFYLQVKDPDENLLPYMAETVLVSVRAQATSDQEWFILTETGLSTGEFLPIEGVSMSQGPVQSGDGVLQVAPPDQLTALYVDGEFPLDSSWAQAEINLPDTTFWVNLTPDQVPIIISPNGGSFSYNVSVANTASTPVVFEAWIIVQLPAGGWYGPVLGPLNLNLSGGASLLRQRTQNVPADAAPGVYTYSARLGIYPDPLGAEDHFAFFKEGVGEWDLNDLNWTNEGESFGEQSVERQSAEFPPSQALNVNLHPNPWNRATILSFELPVADRINLDVFDISGRCVGIQKYDSQPAGFQRITFEESGLPSGIYLYRLQTARQTAMGKMVLIK